MLGDLPIVRSSERGDFKQCPQRWHWRYVEWLVLRTVKPGAREFGTGLHLCMAEHYVPGEKRGADLLETWEKWLKEWKREQLRLGVYDEEQFLEDAEVGRAILDEYEFVYKGDPHWFVIASELPFRQKIRSPNGISVALNVGTIDLVIRDLNDGHVKVVDHKSCKAFPNPAFLALEDQGGSYVSLAELVLIKKELIKPAEQVQGMEFNFLRKGAVDDRPQNEAGEYLNKDGSVSKRQPQPLVRREFINRTLQERKRQVQRIQDDVAVMTATRNGEIPILKSPGKLCSYCDFFDLCVLDENGGDTDRLKKVMYKKVDPYHDHREGARNSKTSVEADRAVKRGF